MGVFPIQVWLVVTMLGLTVVMLIAYVVFLRRGSARRLVGMMRRLGLDPALLQKQPPQNQAVVEDIWRRCRHCQFEDHCERWLARKVGGDRWFCPNAHAFRLLRHP